MDEWSTKSRIYIDLESARRRRINSGFIRSEKRRDSIHIQTRTLPGSPAPIVRPAIDALEIGNLLDRSMSDLSGEKRQRVTIARALNSSPRAPPNALYFTTRLAGDWRTGDLGNESL